jgi:peptidoglycan/xylan/chitin deacetylase (PgdA/CDA1 family)
LGEPPPALADVVLRRAVPRFAEVLARRGVPATFFVVGSDLDPAAPPGGGAARAIVRDLARAGHEIGNHSERHLYDLCWQARARVEEEVDRAHARIFEAVGAPPVGFRAPGYNLSPTMLSVLGARGYRYDSSILPSPPYYAAKAAVMGAMRLAGRRSGSTLGDPRLLRAPLLPYRPDVRAPWRRGQAGLVELPVAASPRLRLWVIGTSLLVAPPWLRARMLETMRARPFFNLELHGIDLIDAEADGIPAQLVARQPDLQLPLAAKRRALEAMLDRIALDFRFATLRDVAAQVQRGEL